MHLAWDQGMDLAEVLDMHLALARGMHLAVQEWVEGIALRCHLNDCRGSKRICADKRMLQHGGDTSMYDDQISTPTCNLDFLVRISVCNQVSDGNSH